MKKGLILLALFTSTLCMAQDGQFPTNEKTGFAEYTEVIAQAGSAQTLHAQAMAWIDTYFKNPTGTVKENEAGKSISGKTRFKVYQRDKKGKVVTQTYVNFNFKLEFKDGKYKYTIDRINWQKPSYFDVTRWEDKEANGYQANVYPSYVEQAVTYFGEFIAAMQDGIATPLEAEAGDW